MPYFSLLTQQGRDAIVDAETGLLLEFTRLGLSEDVIADPNDIDPMTPPDLAVTVYCGILGVARTAPSQMTITSRLNLLQVTNEFLLWSIGIYATVAGGPEILYGVVYCDTGPETIRPGSPTTVIDHTFQIVTVVGNATNVTAVFFQDFTITNIGLVTDGAGFYSRRIGNEFFFKRLRSANLDIVENDDIVSISAPIVFLPGMMVPYAGTVFPMGWLPCVGQAIGRALYPTLYAIIGDTFGAGDGVTTFNLPDCQDRTIVGVSPSKGLGARGGAETHTLTLNEMASHDHFVQDRGHYHGLGDAGHAHGVYDPQHDHAFVYFNYAVSGVGNQGSQFGNNFWGFTGASPTNIGIYPSGTGQNIGIGYADNLCYPSGGNAPHNNMPPYLALFWIIKT